MSTYKNFILKPDIRQSSEIKYHYDNAPGQRYVFLDKKKCPESSMYTIVRVVKDISTTQDSYIDPHTHTCDSEFLFIGDNDDMTGLTARVWLGDEEFLVQSPAAVFVPRNVEHTLQLVAGSGKFINIVPNPDYNESLR
jgi:2-isopropylmalate synthase